MKKSSIKDFINKTIFIEEEDDEEEVVAETTVVVEPQSKQPEIKQPEIKTVVKPVEEVKVVKKEEPVKNFNNVFTKVEEPKIVPVKPVSETKYATTVISKGTKLMGNISCKADLQIDGDIEGDVNCEGNVVITGKVKGNIRANLLTMESATVVGNVTCKGLCSILSSTSLTGDVKSGDVIMEGEIAGNIIAEAKVTLKGTAILDGNCTSGKIVVDEGAVIAGSIQTVVKKKD